MSAPNPRRSTRILRYGPAAIAEAAHAILAGDSVAVPTETVYGLAADATDAAAVAGIYAAKGRPSFNPLIVHLPDPDAVARVAVMDADARRLADAFWPGPLTLVLPLAPGAAVAGLVTAGLDTVVVRVPAHRAMRALLDAAGRPLAAPSANRSGGISPTRAAHVAASLDGRIGLVIDDGPTRSGLESTIVAPGPPPRLLRPGPITAEMVEAVLGARLSGAEPGRITAPGQLSSHYAPAKPLRLGAAHARPDEWLIGFGAVEGQANLSPGGDLVQAAARLFDELHRADASDAAAIAVAPVPDTGLGRAINDRLARAAVR